MKGLIVLCGESFRYGEHPNRTIGSDVSYKAQMEACNSHLNFIKHLETLDCNSKVFISTYTTKFDKDLIGIYSNFLLGYNFETEKIGQYTLFQQALSRLEYEEYDFILYLRIDLVLKDEFLRVFNPTWSTIRFPFICWRKEYSHKEGGHPRISDMLLFIPNEYYSYIYLLQHYDHDHTGHRMWIHFVEKGGLTYDSLDTMIDTYHDSDSEKDWNPLYYVVNRPEATTFYSRGHIFDKFNYD